MGIGGSLQDSTINNVWIEHVQAGIWMTGPFTNLKISNVRIQDTVADGINFDGGDHQLLGHQHLHPQHRRRRHRAVVQRRRRRQRHHLARHRAAAGPGEQLRHLRRQRQLDHQRLRHRHDHPGRRHPGRQPVRGRAAGRHHHHRRQHAGPGRHPRPELAVRRGRDLVLRLRRRGHDRDDQRRSTTRSSTARTTRSASSATTSPTPPRPLTRSTTSTSTTTSSTTSARSSSSSSRPGRDDTISNVVSTGTVGLDGTMACGYGITPTYGSGQHRVERLGVHVPAVRHTSARPPRR